MGRNRAMFGILGLVVVLFSVMGVALAAMGLPEGLKDVPLYPGSKIEQTMDMDGHSMATIQVQAKRDAVLEYYKKHFVAGGWKIAFQAQQEEASMIHFQKDKHMLHLNVQGEEQEETVTYTLVRYQ